LRVAPGQHAGRDPLDVDAAVTELREITGGRADLLGEVAGRTLGFGPTDHARPPRRLISINVKTSCRTAGGNARRGASATTVAADQRNCVRLDVTPVSIGKPTAIEMTIDLPARPSRVIP
jgi:hypothetical protein